MSLDLSASDIRQLAQGPGGQVPYAKAINALKKRLDILPSSRVRNASTKKKVKERQTELIRTLKDSGQEKLAQQFTAAFKDPHNLHSTSQQAINTYLAERLKDNPSIAPLTATIPYNLTPQSSRPPVQASGPASVPDSPFQQPPPTPQQTPQPGAMPTPGVSPIAPLGPEPAPAPDSDEELTEDNSPGEIFEESFSGPVEEEESSSTTTTTPSGEQVVEQLQKSMATSSELVSKAAQAVDASAKATTELQETVKDTTDALKTLTEAQTKTETASPALSQQVLAQIQADPSLAKLVKDGLLKWDDLLGKNPEPGKEGHVAGVTVGDPVVLPGKLQKVIDNLQSARVRESASLTGAIEVNRAARTTTGFRPSDTGYFPGRQVWMPIRAPPPSLPGRR